MRDFVQNISQYAKNVNPNFIVIPQNGHDIIMDDYDPNDIPNQDYLQAIDGLGREDLFYGYESDNKHTAQSVTREIISFLDIYEKKGLKVLVTDYASTKSKMRNSYKQNAKKGYIPFVANRRELDNIPIFPPAPFNENDSDITTLADAKNFLYVLDPGNKNYFVNETNFLSSIGQTNYDLLIIDAFLDQKLILTSSQVAALKRKRNGSKRLVIAYMSMGEAETYRYYWQHEWLLKPPVWLKGANPDWPGNYLVEYWHPEWQSIIWGNDQSYLRKILDSGFDGVYLDIVDAYERFEEEEAILPLATVGEKIVARLIGKNIYVFNGIPKKWGQNLVYRVDAATADTRTMGALGGIPIVDAWTENGGIAIFNTATYHQPFTVSVKYDKDGVTIEAAGGNQIEVFEHQGDYYEAIREFALRMQAKGLSVKSAPAWAFNAIWETYGFEEDYNVETIMERLPLLKDLGIRTITIDAGWYGKNRGEEIDFRTGDFKVNPDIIGSEETWTDLIHDLHDEGFRVRVWWAPGVAEEDTNLWNEHPNWFTKEVVSSTGDTSDIYLDPSRSEVQIWNTNLVKRFLSYGVDGFKQDDIYNYISSKPQDQHDYADLINGNLEIAQSIKNDFVINTCNCGVAQNFFQMSGQNQLITADPVGSQQFRRRAKYLHALNVNNAAILGDHIELTAGDVGPDDLDQPGFYDQVDFASVVPLGMVLETKFRQDPGQHYRKWFKIYNRYRFHQMEWINIPLRHNQLETYLMKDGDDLYYSFFKENAPFSGKVQLTHLTPDLRYRVYELLTDHILEEFVAISETYKLDVNFVQSLVLVVKPSAD